MKLSDKNHVRKNMSNALYKLQEKHKSLSTKAIIHLLKDVSYAISQNKGNAKDLETNLKAIFHIPLVITPSVMLAGVNI